MKVILKRVGFGIILWAIPYVTAIPLLPLQQSNLLFFKALMVLTGSVVAGILAILYFKNVQKNFLRESLYVAGTWLTVNWLLDFAALLPFTKQTIPQYFMEIGIEYIGGMAMIIAIGYLLEKKVALPKV